MFNKDRMLKSANSPLETYRRLGAMRLNSILQKWIQTEAEFMCKQEKYFVEGGPWNLTFILREEWVAKDCSQTGRMNIGTEGWTQEVEVLRSQGARQWFGYQWWGTKDANGDFPDGLVTPCFQQRGHCPIPGQTTHVTQLSQKKKKKKKKMQKCTVVGKQMDDFSMENQFHLEAFNTKKPSKC